MKINDKVEVTLYDKIFTGSIIKVHRKDGWQEYVDVVLDEDKQKIVIPKSFLKVVD